MSVDYSCSSGMVTVTWALVFGANSYRATAVDSTGASLNCTSASTSCHITMLKCGEKYHVHVTVISDDCENSSNTSALFETGEQPTWLTFPFYCFLCVHCSHVPHHLSLHNFSFYLSPHTFTLQHIRELFITNLPPTSCPLGGCSLFFPWCLILISHAMKGNTIFYYPPGSAIQHQ